jgi:hypothetical protein
VQDLDEVFGPHGPLKRSLPGYTPRRSQLAMAGRIAGALTQRTPLVVEAGTGTGKTFAYLVPALLSGKRVLISTGTRTLQDQLFNKDLPLVAGAIGVPRAAAISPRCRISATRIHCGRRSLPPGKIVSVPVAPTSAAATWSRRAARPSKRTSSS